METANKAQASARITHNMAQRLKLADYVKHNYTASGLTDLASAAQATIDLGFQVTEGQVRYMRDAFEIQSNRPHRATVEKQLEPEVAELRAQIDALTTTVSGLMLRIEKLERFEFANYPRHIQTPPPQVPFFVASPSSI